MFDWRNIDRLSSKMEQTMESFINKKAKSVVDEHPEIIKLIQLYNDEFASGNTEPDERDSESDTGTEVSESEAETPSGSSVSSRSVS